LAYPCRDFLLGSEKHVVEGNGNCKFYLNRSVHIKALIKVPKLATNSKKHSFCHKMIWCHHLHNTVSFVAINLYVSSSQVITPVHISDFLMPDLKEQHTCATFCSELRNTAFETHEVLIMAFADNATGKTQTFEWEKLQLKIVSLQFVTPQVTHRLQRGLYRHLSLET
jgi:hypothetical protein